MSEIAAMRFCTRQALKGNWKAWRFLLHRWWNGLRTRTCVGCGCEKGRTLCQYCCSCQWKNIKKALMDGDE